MTSTNTNLVIASVVLTGLAFSTATTAQEGRWSSATSQEWQGISIDELRDSSEESFDLLDANDNGRITLDEIDIDFENLSEEEARNTRRRASIAQEKFMKWDEEIDRFDIADTNKDGVLDRPEREAENKSVRTHMLQLGLDELDTDKNGSIDRQEFGAHLSTLEDMDDDGDGYVSREELAESEESTELLHAVSREMRRSMRDRWVARRQQEEEEQEKKQRE